MSKRLTPQSPPIAIYLGGGDDRRDRIKRLDALAKQYGVNRSVLVRMIADGELTVTPAPDQRRTRTA